MDSILSPFLRLVVLASMVLWAGAISAQQFPPLEPDALIGQEFSPRIAQTGAMTVREAGYRCDTISAFVLKSMFSTKAFTLKCNEHRYSYTIENRNGRGIITMEEGR